MKLKKLIEYNRLDWTLSYLCTKEGQEIDLVIQLPRKQLILVERKSSKSISESDIKSLVKLGNDLDKQMKTVSKKILISQDPQPRLIQYVQRLHFKDALMMQTFAE